MSVAEKEVTRPQRGHEKNLDAYAEVPQIGSLLLALREKYSPEDPDNTPELAVLRAYAIKLLQCLSAGITRDSYKAFLVKKKGISADAAEGAWLKFQESEWHGVMQEYVSHTWPDLKVSAHLAKVLSEIRAVSRQIADRQRKSGSSVESGAIGEFFISVAREVESRFNRAGVKDDEVKDFRKWFADSCADFMARNSARK